MDALLSRIFPPACRIVPAESVPSTRRFVIIPGHDGPRWIVPLDWSIAAPVLRQWSPIDPVSRAKWRAVLMAYRLGCIERIPGTTVVGLRDLDFSSWHRLGLTPSTEFVPIVYVARPSTTQKAIVSLYSVARQNVDCVVKVALGTCAWSSIEKDYLNLQSVEQLFPGLAPRPIALAPDLGMASQQWAAGKMCLHPPAALADSFLTMLWQERPTSLRGIAQQFHERFHALPCGEIAGRMERIFDSVKCDDQVPSAFYHGDFVSWNLVCRDDNQCCAIDWEFGERDGAPLMDLFHFWLGFALAAGTVSSYQMAAKLTLGTHDSLVRAILDRLGASYDYAKDALSLTFIAIYVTRFHQLCAVERIQPQLRAFASTFDSRP